MILKAYAKINLGLTVVAGREDGYHQLKTVMQQVSLADYLVFKPCDGEGWRFTCSNLDLSGGDNLVCRAADLLLAKVDRPLPGVEIKLYKNIPHAAGLGGGSSDAAAALIGLNRFWQLGLTRKELMELGARLGSDVPYCLLGGTVLARGRGEILEPLPPLPFFWVVLALPAGVTMATADVYRLFDRSLMGKPRLDPLVEAIREGSREGLANWLAGDFTNTLETAILPGTEALRKMKRRMRKDGLRPALSGSGPTLFLMTGDYSLARNAARIVANEGNEAYLCWTVNQQEECC